MCLSVNPTLCLPPTLTTSQGTKQPADKKNKNQKGSPGQRLSRRIAIMPKSNKSHDRSRHSEAPYGRKHKGKRDGDGEHKHGKKRNNHRIDDDKAPVATFDEMNLKPDLLRGIYAYGFEKPSAIQQRAIRPIVRGRDVIAQSQSGTGKTAVFSIAALQLLDETSRDVQVLVLSPTRELAEQSQRVLQSLGDFMNVCCCVARRLFFLCHAINSLFYVLFLFFFSGILPCLYWWKVFGK